MQAALVTVPGALAAADDKQQSIEGNKLRGAANYGWSTSHEVSTHAG